MRNLQNWQGLPYHPISQHYREVFGEKVYKIPVSVAESCPNRDGLNGMKTCNFCDAWGSAAYPDLQKISLQDQIIEARRRILTRVNCGKFLIYFQAYTTTFAKVAQLRSQIAIALDIPDVVGVVIGTRPDCISDALFELLNETAEKVYVAVEFGVQTFDEAQLIWMRRGHTAKKSVDAIYRMKEKCSEINLGIHMIFGLPNENHFDVERSARICNRLPIDNVKLHHLHVLKNTPLADEYRAGTFKPLSREEYSERVKIFLQYLDPRIAVHRLAALSAHPEELVAPDWTTKKMETYQFVLDWMNTRNAFQGQLLNEVVNHAGL